MDCKSLNEYPNYSIYEDGQVYSHKTEKFIVPWLHHRFGISYYILHLWQNNKPKTFYLHRIVAEAFLGPPPFPGAQIRHLDGNSLNNHYSNLAWGTAQENMNDSKLQGKMPAGEHHWNCKLTSENVDEIRTTNYRSCGRILAKKFNVSPSMISMIRHRKNWR